MKMVLACELMRKATGYRVHFERRGDGMLYSDHFPERDEPPIAELEDAWKLAAQFANVDPTRYVNVYVINALDGAPVDDYQLRTLNVYPPAPPQEPGE